MTFQELPDQTEQAVVAQPVAYEPVQPAAYQLVEPVSYQQVKTAYAPTVSPDTIIAAIVGLALLLVGLIAVIRAGLDAPFSEPVIQVAGFAHTAVLGMVELAFGLCLLASAAGRSRSGETFFGGLLAVAGFVGAVQTESFASNLALESSLAWLVFIAGAVVMIAALVLPRVVRRSSLVQQR